MNYMLHYNRLIETRQRMVRNKRIEIFENHHIVPRCLGGSNDSTNLVLLTPKEHYVAHHLLYKAHHGKTKARLAYAFFKMCQCNDQQHRKITAKMFNTARIAITLACSGTNASGYNRKRTDEERQHLSNLRMGCNNPMYGVAPWNKGHTKDTHPTIAEKTVRYKQRLANGEYDTSYKHAPRSEAFKNTISKLFKGVPKTLEHKRRLSEALRGRKRDPDAIRRGAEKNRGRQQPLVTCPHCGKVGSHSAMYRWHFDACKHQP